MKVLFLADVPMNAPASGSEMVLNRQMIGLRERGHTVNAITRRGGPAGIVQRDVGGAIETCYGAAPDRPVQFAAALLTQPFKCLSGFPPPGPPDVVVAHQPFTCFSLLIRGALRGVPMAYVFHSPSHREYRILHANRRHVIIGAWLRRRIEAICIRRASRMLVLSQYIGRLLVSDHRIARHQIRVAPGGADSGRFRPVSDRKRLKCQLRLPPNRIHLLTVRNLEPRMGLIQLVAAMARCQRAGLPAHLVIAGDGPERDRIKAAIAQSGAADSIRLEGFVPAARLPDYYSAADWFVIPTQAMEGFGLVIPEAMACGTPVLGTPVGAIPEVIGPFDRDLLFRDASSTAMTEGITWAIERHLSDPAAYAELRQRCRTYAQTRFSWDRHVDCLEGMLLDIQNPNRP